MGVQIWRLRKTLLNSAPHEKMDLKLLIPSTFPDLIIEDLSPNSHIVHDPYVLSPSYRYLDPVGLFAPR